MGSKAHKHGACTVKRSTVKCSRSATASLRASTRVCDAKKLESNGVEALSCSYEFLHELSLSKEQTSNAVEVLSCHCYSAFLNEFALSKDQQSKCCRAARVSFRTSTRV